MDISIGIVNYKSSDLVIKAINSIVKHTIDVKYEIIIVNNSPEDKGILALPRLFSKLNLYIYNLKENLGFSRANNIAFKKSSGKYFLTYNPDLFLIENTIKYCWIFLEKNESYNCCTVKFTYPDNTSQTSAFFKQKGAQIFYGSIPYAQKFTKHVKIILPSNQKTIEDVDVVCGAFLFIRSDTYSEIKGYDETFFLYAEDWEISNRIGKTGKIALLNETKVIHVHGGASKKEFNEEGTDLDIYSRKGTQMFVSILLWQKKEFGNLITVKLYIIILISFLLNTLSLIRNLFNKKSKKKWKLYFKSILIITKEVVLIIFNKKKVYKTI